MEVLANDGMAEPFDKTTAPEAPSATKKTSPEQVETKNDPPSRPSTPSAFVLPLRKRLKTSSPALMLNPGQSDNTSYPSSPTSPPSSPSLALSLAALKKVEKHGEDKQEVVNGRTKAEEKGIPDEIRKRKKRMFEPSLFAPLPPRQAKVDSYKKASRDSRDAKNKTKPQKKRKIHHDSSSSASSSESEEEKLYCLCKQPYDEQQFMIACDTCDDWFHVKCVNLTERKAKTLATYVCPACTEKKESEKAEKQKRRREEEKEKERKREAKRIKSEEEEEEEEEPKVVRVCANENCKNPAKPNSKYCSTKCGILVAKQKLSEKQKATSNGNEGLESGEEKRGDGEGGEKEKSAEAMEEELLKSKTLSVSESEDFKTLKLLESQKLDTEVNLALVQEKRTKLAEAIKFSTTLVAPADSTKTKANKNSSGGAMDIMDCFSCGQPIPGKKFARHMELCYAKKEGNVHTSAFKNDDQVTADGTTLAYCNYYDARSGSYCTRLADSCPFHSDKKKQKAKRNQLCGCPTTDFESGHCERLKRECGKHVNWESIRSEELDQELKRLTQVRSSVQDEIEIVKSRIKRRSMLDDSQHRTIEEN